MGVRSARTRGGRPRDRAPRWVASWTVGSPSRRAGGERRRFPGSGRPPSWARAGACAAHYRGRRAGLRLRVNAGRRWRLMVEVAAGQARSLKAWWHGCRTTRQAPVPYPHPRLGLKLRGHVRAQGIRGHVRLLIPVSCSSAAHRREHNGTDLLSQRLSWGLAGTHAYSLQHLLSHRQCRRRRWPLCLPLHSLLLWAKAMPIQSIAHKSVKSLEEVAKKGQYTQRWQMSRSKQWQGVGNRDSTIRLDFSKSYEAIQI
jgi:hypothetical protein